jgi:iron complex transport system substrate-binding protein
MNILQTLPRGCRACLLLLLIFASPASGRTVVDATGRSVILPDRIERVMPAGPPATVLLYTLAPQLMIGWTHPPSEAAQALLDHSAANRPGLPVLMHDSKVAVEQIREAKPDLILDYGSVTPRYADRARQVQRDTGVPFLLLDGKLEHAPEIYRLLGPVLSVEARGSELAAAAERLLDMTRQRVAARGEAAPVRVYYARSADALTTTTNGSLLGDVVRLVGATNVADSAGSGELVTVTRQQVFGWNPDAIVTNNPGFVQTANATEWVSLNAIAKSRVYLAPSLPFGWIDEPPSVNRLLGLLWAGHVLYPAGFPEDLRAATRDFYHRFYRVELRDDQLDALLR